MIMLYMCVLLFQILYFWTDFYEILCELYYTGGHTDPMLFNSL